MLSATPFGQEFENVYETRDDLRSAIQEWFPKYDYTNWQFTYHETLAWPELRSKLPPKSKSLAWGDKLLDDQCYVVCFTFVTSQDQPDTSDSIQAWVRVKR